MRDLLVVATFLTLLPLSFVSALVGVLEWVWFALLQPSDVLYGFGAAIPYNKIIAIVTLAVMLFTREKKSFYVDTTTVLLLLFAAIVTISYMTALAYGPDVDELYAKIIKEIVLYCVITFVIATRHRLHLLLISVILGLCFVGNKEGFIAILAGGGHHIIGTSSVGDNNSLATALLMIIPLMYFVIQYSAVRIIRSGLWVSVALNVIA
ncbi:MAG: hypothetical protein INR62_08040, partial [Rhodospirillales bacterium]|nr:hypothetical protein [Acetobacter sp.]